MAPTSPEVAKLEFAKRVRDRRRELGLSSAETAKALGFSRVFYSAVENNREKLSPNKLPALFDVLQFEPEDRKQLTALHDASRRPGWWAEYASVLPEEFAVFIGLEHGASRASIFESSVVPGLLQTRDYAEAVVGAATRVSLADVRRTVDLRLRRQQRLSGDDPLRLDVILSEAVLMQQFGSSGVLRDQLRSILDRIEAGAPIDLRVQPFATTPGGLFAASTVVLLDFESAHLPTMTWREAVHGLGISADAELIADLGVQFEQLRGTSLSPEASAASIAKRIAEL